VESDDLTYDGVLILTPPRRGLIAASMINAATIIIARRRISAVWAVVCA
jgi:hypothetical protein